MLRLYQLLWVNLTPVRRKQFAGLLLLTIVAAIAEVVSIGAVLPFLAVLTDPVRVFSNPNLQPVVKALGAKQPEDLLLPLVVTFCVVSIAAGGVRLVLTWVNVRLAYAIGADLSSEIYRRTLFQPYAVHLARNSSQIIAGMTTKVSAVIGGVIAPTLLFASSSFMLSVVLLVMLSIEPVMSILAFASFALLYGVIASVSKRSKQRNGALVAKKAPEIIKTVSEGLGGIRDILLDGAQEAYCQTYRNSDLPLRRAQGSVQIAAQSPRYVLEAFGMCLIAILAYFLSVAQSGLTGAIPILGMLALGAQRLLPLMQNAYASWASIQGNKASFEDVLALLLQPMPDEADTSAPVSPIPFKQSFRLNQVGFRYAPDAPWILDDLTLSIKKGERIGIIGETGAGKSTLLDVVMGLLAPTRGSIVVDDHKLEPNDIRAWQAHLAHVPQAIFLSDSSIEENIAFGVPREKIESARVKAAAKQAQLDGMIDSLPLGYKTVVGERGIRLSGGQRQRIGIARALYKQADVIIFDEATSALDNETESAVMDAINSLSDDLTLFIIAHRLTTLKGCTQVVELQSGNVRRIGSYEQIIGTKAQGSKLC